MKNSATLKGLMFKGNMKKILLMLTLLYPNYMLAQEPEFIGEVNIMYNDSIKLLDKEYMAISSKADASLVLFGIGSINTEIVVPRKSAKTRVPENTELHIIAKASDNLSDPMSVIRVFQFEAYHSSRKALIATADVFGSSNNKFNSLTFHASKYGKSSYDIKISSLPVGEYGVIVSNPNNRDSKSALIYCFGVGKPKAHSGWRQYNPDGVY